MYEKVEQALKEGEIRSSRMAEVEEEMEREYPLIDRGFKTIMKEQYNLFAKKHLDYGMKNIAAGTNLENPNEVKFALTGLWFRISDKVNRWQNTLESDRSLYNESLLDTFQDIVNYGIISQLVYRGLWKKEECCYKESKYESSEEG